MPPIVEFNPELKRPIGLANEFILVQSKHTIEASNLRNGRLTDTDCADGV